MVNILPKPRNNKKGTFLVTKRTNPTAVENTDTLIRKGQGDGDTL